MISPEGCASILWRDGKKAPEAAEALKITSESLKKLAVIDEIIAEPKGAAHSDPGQAIEAVKKTILKHLKALKKLDADTLVQKRYDKYAAMGR